MIDANKNMIPDRFDPYVGAAFALAGAVLVGISQYTEPIPKWIPIVMGILTAVASIFKFGMIQLPGAKVAKQPVTAAVEPKPVIAKPVIAKPAPKVPESKAAPVANQPAAAHEAAHEAAHSKAKGL